MKGLRLMQMKFFKRYLTVLVGCLLMTCCICTSYAGLPTIDGDTTALKAKNPMGIASKDSIVLAASSGNSKYAIGAVRNFEALTDDLFKAYTPAGDSFGENEGITPVSEDVEALIKRANDLYDLVKKEQRYAEFLDASALVDLPIGIVGKGGNADYAILIDKLVITPVDAYIEVFVSIPIPQSSEHLTFRGTNIRFTKAGGLTGDVKLTLLKDVGFDFFGSGESAKTRVIVKGGDGHNTSAEWDCNGFKHMDLDMEVLFSKDWIKPVDPTQDRVKGNLQVKVTNWKDLVTDISLSPFKVASLDDVEFHITHMVFDFSDKYNATGVKFPPSYNSTMFKDGNINGWRGFYIQAMEVVLPKEFARRDDKNRITFHAEDVLIDNMGFTGMLEVKNLIPDNGDMNGWVYSLDSLAVRFEANELKSAGFRGNVALPVSDNNKRFKYTAIINPGSSYLFNIKSMNDIDFSIWMAKVKLLPGSSLDINVINGKFKPKATLNGTMSIASSSNDLSLVNISFEQLVLSTESPYLDVKTFSFSSKLMENSMKGFPISFRDIGLKTLANGQKSLHFDIVLSLTETGGGDFGGDAVIEIVAEHNDVSKKWQYKRIIVSEIGIKANINSFKLEGRIKMFDDDLIYGKGYNGTLSMSLTKGFQFKLEATAIFGKVNGYRYWFSDAFMELPKGIPCFWILSLYGFGGGAFHNMKQVGFSNDAKYSPGKSISGVIYTPAKDNWGLKATIELGITGERTTLNADVTFEIDFANGWGVRKISLLGNAYFLEDTNGGKAQLHSQVEEMMNGEIMAPIGEMRKKAQISAHSFIYYDFENDVLHGDMVTYANVAEGALKGGGPDGLVGRSVIHVAHDKWYIWIGTPDKRISLEVLDLVKMDSYMMTGSHLPAAPKLPPNVAAIFGNVNLDYMRDLNALERGGGFMLGGSFTLDTGDKTFLIFYAKFAMGAGFDLMLKDYGDEVHCKGSTGKIGISGWYASGDSYAFMEGKIGMTFKLFGSKKKKDILSIAAAVVLQTKMPNPFWMRGIVGGHYSIMGGLIKGTCKFQLTIGKECQVIDGSVVEGLNIIADVTPQTGGTNVDVFTTPQVVFNFVIDKEFSMMDIDEITKDFRIKMDHFTIKDGTTNIQGTLEWNSSKDVVAFQPFEILPPHKELVGEVQLSFEERIGGGAWSPIRAHGKVLIETRVTKFTTGEAPDYIPASNVAYSYPLLNQLNFYKSEYPQGYIKLKRGQSYLFQLPADVWVQKGRFAGKQGGATAYFDFNYNAADKQINFDIPGSITNDKLYAVELVSIPATAYQGGAVDRNVTQVTSQLDPGNVSLDAELTTKKAEGTIDKLEEHVLFQGAIKTSRYNTFNEKVNSFNLLKAWLIPDPALMGAYEIASTIRSAEYFDKAELQGIETTPPLIQIVANLDDNAWYNSDIYPLVYDGYPFINGMRIRRNPDLLGLPPVRATYFRQDVEDATIVQDEDASSSVAARGASIGKVSYQLDNIMMRDYYDIETYTANYYASFFNDATPRMKYILTKRYPGLRNINYKVDVQYVLPGINKVTSSRSIMINPF